MSYENTMMRRGYNPKYARSHLGGADKPGYNLDDPPFSSTIDPVTGATVVRPNAPTGTNARDIDSSSAGAAMNAAIAKDLEAGLIRGGSEGAATGAQPGMWASLSMPAKVAVGVGGVATLWLVASLLRKKR
jgi:hypothetical protein